MRSMPGWSIHWAASRLTFSYTLLAGNGDDLIAFLDGVPNHPTPALPSRALRQSVIPVQVEAARLLHNFLASAKTLVDHSRLASRSLVSAAAQAGYAELIKAQIMDHQPRAFIQDLRNYFLHVSNPVMVTRVSILHGSSSLCLVRERLLEHSGWKPRTMDFLKSDGGDIPIVPLVHSYLAAAFAVTASLLESITREHRDELEDLYQLSDAVSEATGLEGLSADDPLLQRFGEEPANMALQRAVSGRL